MPIHLSIVMPNLIKLCRAGVQLFQHSIL